MVINNNGNVGIGKIPDDATYKLDVCGKIRATKVTVTQMTGCDFVFAKDYKLMSLYEVEKFIKQNNHLPEIPPASEVEEHGADIGMMQSKLLQKVEELTLYMIEQNKKIAELEKKVNEQSKINR